MTTQDSGTSNDAGVANARPPVKMPVKRRLTLVVAAVVLVLLPAIVMVLVTWAGTGEVQGAAT
jgi:hypothetical protein